MKYIFIIFFSFSINAQNELPFVKNYNKIDYAGDNQIWNITQTKDGAMYFANNQFLLRYNGVVWEKYSMPNKTTIRSVFAIDDKIFVGSYNEFGYWYRVKGQLNYISLSNKTKLFSKAETSEEIWKIFSLDNKIYFQSFSHFYVFDKGKITQIKLPTQISYAFKIDNQLLLGTTSQGIITYNLGKFISNKQFDALKGFIIHGIEKIENTLYVFTQKNGIFVYQNHRLEAWNHPLNSILKKQGIITAKKQNQNTLLIGTSSNGLYIVNPSNNSYSNLNKANLLKNNTVLNIFIDHENDIWLGLDNGIAQIENASNYRLFQDYTGQLGSVYAIKKYKKGLLLGSNHGLFLYENNKTSWIENSQGHVWNIFQYNENEYLIGHNEGTFVFNNGEINKLNHINGGWTVKKNIYDHTIVQSNYTGLTFYNPLSNCKEYQNFTYKYRPIKDFLQISTNEWILIDNHKGLFFVLTNHEKQILSVKNITKINNIENDYNIKHFQHKNLNLFYINNSWFTFDALTFKLIPNQLFNQNFKDISEMISINDQSFAVLKNGILSIINQINKEFSWHIIPKKYYNGKLINNYTKIHFHDNYYYINIDDGFLIYQPKKQKIDQPKITIEAFENKNLIDKQSNISYNSTLKFHIISPYLGSNYPTLFFQLNQEEIKPLEKPLIQIQKNESGRNNLNIFTFDGVKYNLICNYNWNVKNPWYFSFWMILFYFIIFSVIMFLYYKWNNIKYLEKIKLKEEEIKHNSQIIQLKIESENQLKIQEIEKQLLENQVNIKANELAGKSLSIAKQTELIDQIQNILNQEDTSSKSIKFKINQVIKSNKLNKNEWKSFESNLLKSNEQFVQILNIKYPFLTPKDIKLCIYLKMNLSSKEIAPLMNISYRGVELHRYRLRKKMLISNETNINSFMNNLK